MTMSFNKLLPLLKFDTVDTRLVSLVEEAFWFSFIKSKKSPI